VVVETDEEGKAPYRASLRNEPLPPGRDTLPPVPDALYRDLVARSLSIAQMARELGVNPTTVQRRLDRMGLRTVQQKNLEFYKRKRADLLAMSQVEILDAITPEKLAAANLEALTRSFGTLYDRERLERGLSTETIDVNRGVSRAGALEELQSRILQRLGVERLPAPPTIEVLESPDAG
jgi:AraC-like DNA-binding protein